MSEDINGAFGHKILLRAEERARRAARLPQHYESLEAYHEETNVDRRAPLQERAAAGFEPLKRRR